MITSKKAADIIKKNYPKTNPIQVFDFDEKQYVVEAPKTKDEPDFSAPYFYVTKDGEKFGPFNPIEHLDKFIEATSKSYKVR